MLLCSSIFEHETAASMITILKHYVVQVVHPHTDTSGLFLEENPREYFTSHLQETFFPAKPMQDSPNKFALTFPCALNTALTCNHSTSGGTADLFVELTCPFFVLRFVSAQHIYVTIIECAGKVFKLNSHVLLRVAF